MPTIRRRLTLWYTVALAVTVLAFGAALYLERRQASVRELDQRLNLESDLAHRGAFPGRAGGRCALSRGPGEGRRPGGGGTAGGDPDPPGILRSRGSAQ